MTTLQASTTALRRHASSTPSMHWFGDASTRLRVWLQRMRSRDTLAGLDERMLKDIGLTRADVTVEIDKPFWRD